MVSGGDIAQVPPTLCAWSSILRAPSKRSPLGFVMAVWDSADDDDGHATARTSKRIDNGAADTTPTAGRILSVQCIGGVGTLFS